MAVDSTNVQLKNAIRSMLGINVLDVLENDILRNLKKVSKQDADNKTSEELEALRTEKDHAAVELEQITAKLSENTTAILEEHNNELEALHQLYTAKGGDAVEKKQETIQKRAKLKSELEAEENKAYEIVANELPLALVADLIQDIKLQAVDGAYQKPLCKKQFSNLICYWKIFLRFMKVIQKQVLISLIL